LLKIIITGGTSSGTGGQFVFAISNDNKGYVWGENRYAISGFGGGGQSSLSSIYVIPRPTPIATGIGDPFNPNPLY
jgi:hypothetical protein